MELLIRRAQQKQAPVASFKLLELHGGFHGDTQKWMVQNGKSQSKVDDDWGYPPRLGKPEELEVCSWENPEVGGI